MNKLHNESMGALVFLSVNEQFLQKKKPRSLEFVHVIIFHLKHIKLYLKDSIQVHVYKWYIQSDTIRAGVCRPCDTIELTATIVHFKRLGSRHFVKEMEIQSILLIYNLIFRKTNLKPFLKYIQKVSKSSRLSNLMRLKVRQCTFVVRIISHTACFNRGVHSFL